MIRPGVGDFVALMRRHRGMSQRSLSARIGRSPAYVSKLESGQLDPGLRGFAAVVTALELTPLEVWILLRLEAAADAITVTPSEQDGSKTLISVRRAG